MMMRRLILCTQLLFIVRGATAAKCPDGSAGLTKALYESGNATAYGDVTCIPENEFKGYAKDVTLSGLPSLKSIETRAFWNFQGNLVFTGEYPALETFGVDAFEYADKYVITLNGLPSLKSIGDKAFFDSDGKITLTGEYPSLETIGGSAFDRSFNERGNAASVITLNGLPSLKSIGNNAFNQFGGTLTFTGEYPALETIKQGAFFQVGNADSVVTFDGLPALKSIETSAFWNFKGKLTVTGEYPKYEGCTRLGHSMNPDPDIVVHAPDQTPLTKAVYEAAASGGGGEFSSITCIPVDEFMGYKGEVTLSGLQSLKHIGGSAFRSFDGTLTITGEYPALETIGSEAFGYYAGNADSLVAIACSSPAGLAIAGDAFRSFVGSLTNFRGTHDEANELKQCNITTTTTTSHWEESSYGCSSLIVDHLETTVQDDPVPNRRIFSSTRGVQTNAIDVSYAIDKATNNTFLGRFEIAVQMYLEDLAYRPNSFELTNENNKNGIRGQFDVDAGSLQLGWNTIRTEVTNEMIIDGPETDWTNLHYFDMYRSGPTTVADGSRGKAIAIRNMWFLCLDETSTATTTTVTATSTTTPTTTTTTPCDGADGEDCADANKGSNVNDGGANLRDMLAQNFSVKKLVEAGYTEDELRVAGVDNETLAAAFHSGGDGGAGGSSSAGVVAAVVTITLLLAAAAGVSLYRRDRRTQGDGLLGIANGGADAGTNNAAAAATSTKTNPMFDLTAGKQQGNDHGDARRYAEAVASQPDAYDEAKAHAANAYDEIQEGPLVVPGDGNSSTVGDDGYDMPASLVASGGDGYDFPDGFANNPSAPGAAAGTAATADAGDAYDFPDGIVDSNAPSAAPANAGDAYDFPDGFDDASAAVPPAAASSAYEMPVPVQASAASSVGAAYAEIADAGRNGDEGAYDEVSPYDEIDGIGSSNPPQAGIGAAYDEIDGNANAGSVGGGGGGSSA